MRMSMRRFTRLTNGFLEKAENHTHSVAIHFMHYNFVRIHQTLRITPAMAAGVTSRLWSLADMVQVIEEWEAGKSAKRTAMGSALSAECKRVKLTHYPGAGFLDPPGRRDKLRRCARTPPAASRTPSMCDRLARSPALSSLSVLRAGLRRE